MAPVTASPQGQQDTYAKERKQRGWNFARFGMLATDTDEVPGSVLLLSKETTHNAPLGMDVDPLSEHRTSRASLPSIFQQSEAMFGRHSPRLPIVPEKKRTADGKIILDPQPEESPNDPLNWSPLKRDAALLSLGFFCMLGGGMTPILAAAFPNVAATYNVTTAQVALTTGLYMMGLGVGSVIASPTAIAFGKRPVYLVAALLFLLTSIWCAVSPNYASLCVARVIQGMAVSPVECLPSATIAEIFFLHERAYRLGVYTLLLLGGKNLIPLVSAAIVQSLSWRWIFWIVAIVVGACWFLLFFFVPESFWARAPKPHQPHRKSTITMPFKFPGPISPRARRQSQRQSDHEKMAEENDPATTRRVSIPGGLADRREERRARFASEEHAEKDVDLSGMPNIDSALTLHATTSPRSLPRIVTTQPSPHVPPQTDYFMSAAQYPQHDDPEAAHSPTHLAPLSPITSPLHYTKALRDAPRKTYLQSLTPYSGRLSHDNWLRVAFRPFILFAYPAILWSSAIYALSVGWLIILSESVSTIYRSGAYGYRFTAIQTGLVYLSPFIGGILGTAVAGKVSDIIVRALAKRNDGVYEPEFRLVMAIPIALSTTIGLWGFGWAAEERDLWIVPTVFFGVISFGCCLGSTTAITFAVDSYRQYAGESLVSLNFAKNILDGLVFSLFFANWLEHDGAKKVFLALGGIQLGFCFMTIPMWLFGKRMRLWTARRGLMEGWK
jgi:hypothetical protein